MKKVFYFFLAATLSVGAFSACDSGKEPAKELKLTADKTTIVADGTDAVTFTVTYGGETVTGATITNITEGNTFTATESGEYKFTATYEGQTSNEVTVTAEAAAQTNEVILSADKYEVAVGEVVTFSATFNGEAVTTFQVCMPGGMCLTSPEWTAFGSGDNNFYGSYEFEGVTYESEEITITVLE